MIVKVTEAALCLLAFRFWSGPLLWSLIFGAAVLLNWPAVISNKAIRLIGPQAHRQSSDGYCRFHEPTRIVLAVGH